MLGCNSHLAPLVEASRTLCIQFLARSQDLSQRQSKPGRYRMPSWRSTFIVWHNAFSRCWGKTSVVDEHGVPCSSTIRVLEITAQSKWHPQIPLLLSVSIDIYESQYSSQVQRHQGKAHCDIVTVGNLLYYPACNSLNKPVRLLLKYLKEWLIRECWFS